MGTAPRPGASRLVGLQENIAAALCWLLPIAASFFFLIADSYKTNRFISFHAWQSLLTVGAAMAVSIGLMIFGTVAVNIFAPFALLMFGVWVLFWLGLVMVSLYMSVKAYSNETPRLPVLGEWAAKQVGM